MRGRKPKAGRLAILEQDRQRVIGGTTPPSKPEWLTPDASAEWDRVVSELSKNYLVTPLDAMTLAAYCQAYAMWRAADRQVREEGLTFVGDNGTIRAHPAAKLCLSLFAELRRMAAEFGFSPAARSRIDVDKPADVEIDDFEQFTSAG